MFYGASIGNVYLGKVGQAIIIGWIVWTLLLSLTIEILKLKYLNTKSINLNYLHHVIMLRFQKFNFINSFILN